MSHILRILRNLTAFVLTAVLTIFPYAGFLSPVLETRVDDCLLNVSMLSDTHIECNEPFRKWFLRAGLKKLHNARSPIDAILIDGDLTNYGDEPSIDAFYDICRETNCAETMLIVAGNHDIGHVEDRDHDAVCEDLIAHYNEFADTSYDKIYYAADVGGYRFIVLCDEGERWDYCTISAEQLAFLDRELSAATANGKPAFVCCHWPIEGTHSEDIVWPDSGLDLAGQDVKSILEQYPNVFYISGHMHAGVKSRLAAERTGISSVEQKNGVTYINLPTYGLVNWFGVPWSGIGAQMEVYADKVIFRPRNFLTGYWYLNSEYTIALTK